MTLTEARAICHTPLQRAPQDATLDLADDLIAKERREEAADIAAAGTPDAFLQASYAAETAIINLRAYSRGMISAEGARENIESARRALRAMALALPQ